MAQMIQVRFLRLLDIHAYAYAICVWGLWILNEMGIVSVRTFSGVPYLSLLPVIYYLFIFKFIMRRSSRYIAYLIGVVLTLLTPLAFATSSGGYMSPQILSVIVTLFLASMLGVSTIFLTVGMQLIIYILALTLSSELGRVNLEFGPYAMLVYAGSGFVGWLVFRSFYINDSTEVSSIRSALRSEQLKSEAILAHMTEGVVIIDSEDTIQVINSVAATLLHLPTQNSDHPNIFEVLGPSISTFDSTAGQSLKEAFAHVRSSGKLVKINRMTVHANGETMEIAGSITQLHNRVEDQKMIMLTIHDVSYFIHLQQTKDDFVSIAGHELRTPLTVIAGYTDRLLGEKVGPLNDKQRHYIDRTRDSVERLTNLVNDMLDINRIESGKAEVHIEEFDSKTACEQVIDDMREYFTAHNMTINADLVACTLDIDRNHLTQILTNLLSNAQKYCPKGSHVDVESETSDTMHTIRIIDNGPGIPEKQQKYIFDKFTRLDTSGKDGTEGTGLGLAISRMLAEQWGGTVGVASDGKTGSCFYITIPINTTHTASNEN